MDIKQHKTTTETYNGSKINNIRTTALLRTAALATEGGLNAFYCYQIFGLDSVVVEAQTMLSSKQGFLTIAMYNQIKLTHYDETEKMAHDSR